MKSSFFVTTITIEILIIEESIYKRKIVSFTVSLIQDLVLITNTTDR